MESESLDDWSGIGSDSCDYDMIEEYVDINDFKEKIGKVD